MLAWAKNQAAPGGMVLHRTLKPVALPNEVLVQVEAFAPNPGDLASLPGTPEGSIPGWDGSGVVLQPAADGQGPKEGERVLFLGLAPGGWAQIRAVPHTMTAAAPSDVSWERLAALPVPAASAMRAVRRLGSVLGRRVLIVGAASAVGRMAVQLATRSGAWVVAVARDENQHAVLSLLGAREVHTTLASVITPVHGAIDVIGGQHLVDAYALLETGGTVLALGHSAGADERFPYGALVADSMTAERSITSFFLGTEPNLAAELGYLAADRDLKIGRIEVRPWLELSRWVEAGAPRRSGRVIFRVSHA